MSDYYIAGDYAGVSGGGYSFYYGYETALCQAVDFDDDDRDDQTEAWRFVVKRGDVVLWSKTADELGAGKDHCEPERVLICGIARWLDAIQPTLDQIR